MIIFFEFKYNDCEFISGNTIIIPKFQFNNTMINNIFQKESKFKILFL